MISKKLIFFGGKIVNSMKDDVVHRMFMDIDFKDRTVLKLITHYGHHELVANPKIDVLLEELWVGKNTYECDGKLLDYSQLTYLLTQPIKKLPGKKISVMQLLSNNFVSNIEEQNFWF